MQVTDDDAAVGGPTEWTTSDTRRPTGSAHGGVSDTPTIPTSPSIGPPSCHPAPPGRTGASTWVVVTLGVVAVVLACTALAVVVAHRGSPDTDVAVESTTTASTTTTTAPATTAPTTTAPATTAPVTVSGIVARSCGARGNGDCFLSLRAGPGTRTTEMDRLSEGSSVQITCTAVGESVTSSALGRPTSVWARTPQGYWVSMAFVDAPGFGSFTNDHPCP